jgi:hypothetical protein
MASLLDTDFKNNVGHIRPYLGIILIGSVALCFGLIIYNATTKLAKAVQPSTSKHSEAEGNLALQTKGTVQYGDTVTYTSSFIGAPLGLSTTNTYITTVCFQDDVMVYQISAGQRESVYLYDQNEGRLEWDGKKATCTATLMYREVTPKTILVSVLNSISFEIEERGY